MARFFIFNSTCLPLVFTKDAHLIKRLYIISWTLGYSSPHIHADYGHTAARTYKMYLLETVYKPNQVLGSVCTVMLLKLLT